MLPPTADPWRSTASTDPGALSWEQRCEGVDLGPEGVEVAAGAGVVIPCSGVDADEAASTLRFKCGALKAVTQRDTQIVRIRLWSSQTHWPLRSNAYGLVIRAFGNKIEARFRTNVRNVFSNLRGKDCFLFFRKKQDLEYVVILPLQLAH